eukprot:6399972-Prymnesium_polylepis.1
MRSVRLPNAESATPKQAPILGGNSCSLTDAHPLTDAHHHRRSPSPTLTRTDAHPCLLYTSPSPRDAHES